MSKFLKFSEQDEIFFLSYPWLFAILAIFFVVLLKHIFNPSTSNAKLALPPSPSKFPIFGNLHNIGLQPHRSLRALAQRFGPLMLLHLGSVPVLVVSSSDAAREIMKTHDLTFANRPKSSSSQKLLYDYKDVSSAPYGEYWRQMKSACVLHFLSNKRVQSFRVVREEETALIIDKIKESSSSALPVNLTEIFAMLTNNVICRAALGRKYSEGEGGKKFKKLLCEFVELLGGFNVGDYIPWLAWVSRINGLEAKMEKVAKEFDAFLEGVVDEHMDRYKRGHNDHDDTRLQHEEQKSFVDVLLEIQRENTVGFPLERVSVKALILDMFAAGTDTTYTVLEWAMTELLRHPEIMKELQKEVRQVCGDETYVSEDDLDKMHYLKAVIKESLRLHPPIPLLVPRISTEDVKIKGYDIARGTQVIINAWAIGRDPLSWAKPEEFLPERILNNSIDFKGHDFELIPFGSGRRICPGILFAMKINELFLANLVHKFDWSLPGGAKEEDLDMGESFGLTTHRRYPLIAIANPSSF
ncbi:Cytochrome P450 - like 10 [Theobroma cacao]|uniref:Cytochrome P450, family 71, subfamily A, polypeptide 25, putative n=1 Tax=Theobroma cacao TaxID=3641 RepID=A0A061FZH7_THECC|nr:Cytochrome P450, family 71, subfamily A, polypeptide 25, putative [Theobroma cacao]WRX18938.1 Cytochrome P450 - like 10 [Theobroma cacao]